MMFDKYISKISIFLNLLVNVLTPLILIGLFYFFSGKYINGNILSQSFVPYYNYLTDALAHCKTFIQAPSTNYDLTLYNGNLYMYWGITPVLFVIPFYLIGGIFMSDIFYTLCAGVINVVIFYALLIKVSAYFNLKLGKFFKYVMLINFAMVSPNYYLSLGGRIWHTNQIIAITYLLLFLLFFIKYLESNFRLGLLAVSMLFFNFAWIARNTLFLYIFIFLYPTIIFLYRRRWDKLIKMFLLILTFLIIGLGVFFIYNHMRFNNIFETGIKYQLSDPRFAYNLRVNRLFSINNFKNNFTHYFLKPLNISLKGKNIVEINPEGNSIFFVYPFIIFTILIFTKRNFSRTKENIFLFILFLIIIAITICLLFFLGTGWTQFGSRYFFDAIPAIFIVCLFVVSRIPKTLLFLEVVYGVLINFFGAVYFYRHF